MAELNIYKEHEEPLKVKLPLFEFVSTDSGTPTSKTYYRHSGNVWKDDATKNLLRQLDDKRTAFFIAVIFLIMSFALNLILWYALATKAYTVQPYKTTDSYTKSSDTTFITK